MKYAIILALIGATNAQIQRPAIGVHQQLTNRPVIGAPQQQACFGQPQPQPPITGPPVQLPPTGQAPPCACLPTAPQVPIPSVVLPPYTQTPGDHQVANTCHKSRLVTQLNQKNCKTITDKASASHCQSTGNKDEQNKSVSNRTFNINGSITVQEKYNDCQKGTSCEKNNGVCKS